MSTDSTVGREWIVDAYGCRPETLRDRARLEALFAHLEQALDLHPVEPQQWHQFPEPGGLTGFVILAESHLACHTFPEHGSMCLSLFCCKPRPEFNWVRHLAAEFGAVTVRVRKMDRNYGGH